MSIQPAELMPAVTKPCYARQRDEQKSQVRPCLFHYNVSMDSFVIAGKSFGSRLIVGTGKYKSGQETARAIEATRVLVKEGFTVLPYTSDDIVVAKRLIDAGASAVMPLGAPIGSGMGIQNQPNIRILREMITDVPLIVDAGVGTASDAAIAMELGADGVLMNTGIAGAQDPVLMAEAMKHAVIAGRQAYVAGRMPKKLYATASSPLEGVVR